MTAVSNEVLAKIDQLHGRYIVALDSKDMGAWLNTFSTDANASYICTTAENVEAKHALAMILDDCHARLRDRVSFVTKVWVGTYSDYRTRHLIVRTGCRAAEDGLFAVESNFCVYYTPSDTGRAEIFATGVYLDRVKVNGEEACFQSRKAVMDNSVLERYMVFPL